MFTDLEIIANDYIMFELRHGLNLANHIKNVLDTGLFADPCEAIDSVMDPDREDSLMFYLIFQQRYEDCAYLKKAFEDIIIQPRGFIIGQA